MGGAEGVSEWLTVEINNDVFVSSSSITPRSTTILTWWKRRAPSPPTPPAFPRPAPGRGAGCSGTHPGLPSARRARRGTRALALHAAITIASLFLSLAGPRNRSPL